MFYKPDESNKEEINAMMDGPAIVDGMHDPEMSKGEPANKSVFVSGLCQSLKNVHQYRTSMIEKIKNQLGNHSIYFRKKQ